MAPISEFDLHPSWWICMRTTHMSNPWHPPLTCYKPCFLWLINCHSSWVRSAFTHQGSALLGSIQIWYHTLGGGSSLMTHDLITHSGSALLWPMTPPLTLARLWLMTHHSLTLCCVCVTNEYNEGRGWKSWKYMYDSFWMAPFKATRPFIICMMPLWGIHKSGDTKFGFFYPSLPLMTPWWHFDQTPPSLWWQVTLDILIWLLNMLFSAQYVIY